MYIYINKTYLLSLASAEICAELVQVDPNSCRYAYEYLCVFECWLKGINMSFVF